MREIASDAGVDPALLYHYFGSKAQLLVAVLRLPHDPPQNVGRALAGGVDGLGERVVREFLGAWASDRGALLGLLLSSVTHEEAARMMREFFMGELAGPVAAAAARPQPQLRAALVLSELTGLAMARFVLRIEPIASADPETLIACYSPTIDRYLTGPLPGDTG
jgi:AcrR family transcriptional regulator